jgi:hypothetical protein
LPLSAHRVLELVDLLDLFLHFLCQLLEVLFISSWVDFIVARLTILLHLVFSFLLLFELVLCYLGLLLSYDLLVQFLKELLNLGVDHKGIRANLIEHVVLLIERRLCRQQKLLAYNRVENKLILHHVCPVFLVFLTSFLFLLLWLYFRSLGRLTFSLVRRRNTLSLCTICTHWGGGLT